MSTYSEFTEAFEIFESYGGTAYDVNAEHDEIFAGPNPRLVSLSDHRKLRNLGWNIDKEIERFYKYV